MARTPKKADEPPTVTHARQLQEGLRDASGYALDDIPTTRGGVREPSAQFHFHDEEGRRFRVLVIRV
jgi:hypothetical protein